MRKSTVVMMMMMEAVVTARLSMMIYHHHGKLHCLVSSLTLCSQALSDHKSFK